MYEPCTTTGHPDYFSNSVADAILYLRPAAMKVNSFRIREYMLFMVVALCPKFREADSEFIGRLQSKNLPFQVQMG